MTALLPGRLRAWPSSVILARNGLAGCATNQAFEDGKQALISGDQERALGLFEQASKEAPDNAEFRATFFRQREVAVAQLLSQADMARLAGRRDSRRMPRWIACWRWTRATSARCSCASR
jgi:general secretion pathway protein D